MESLYEALSRKIKVRQKAQGTLHQVPVRSKERIVQSGNFWKLSKATDIAGQYAVQDGYWEIYSCRKVIGPIIVFCKKFFRKLLKIFLGWYIFPIYNKQSEFNNQIIECIKGIRCCLEDLNNKSATDLQMCSLNQEMQYLLQKIQLMEKELEIQRGLTNKIVINNKKKEQDLQNLFEIMHIPIDYANTQGCEINYLDFENNFRGDSKKVLDSQTGFLPYFIEKDSPILDIGCGRGEFLKFLKVKGIAAYGIDQDFAMVNYCTERGLSVKCSNALTYLCSLDNNSLGGVFMAHVIEHWPIKYTIAVLQQIYRVLRPGSYFVFSTPNPSCLYTLTEFYNDEQHIKPIHFREANYYCQIVGFSKTEVHFVESTKTIHSLTIPEEAFKTQGLIKEEWEFLNKYLYGYREYTIVAQK